MTEEDAFAWVRRVGGALLHNGRDPDGERAWVAVVRTPGPAGRRGKLVVAFGHSVVAAARAAQDEFDRQWEQLSALH